MTDRVDVFAFGVLLWECLSRRPPWRDLGAMQVRGAGVRVLGPWLARPRNCPEAALVQARHLRQPEITA